MCDGNEENYKYKLIQVLEKCRKIVKQKVLNIFMDVHDKLLMYILLFLF